MKKFFSIIIIITILFIGDICYATQEKTNNVNNQEEIKSSLEVSVKAPEVIEKGNNTYIITLALGKFENIKEGNVMAFQTTLIFDEEIVENITVKGMNNWTLTYSGQTKTLIGDIDKAKANQDIGEIEITLKEEIQEGKKTNIEFKDMLFLSDNKEVKLNKKIQFEVIKSKTNEQEKNNIQTNENITNKIEDNTISKKIIPAAGIGQVILISIIILIILAIIFKFKSRKIKY